MIGVKAKWRYEIVCGAHARSPLLWPDQDGRCAPTNSSSSSSCCCSSCCCCDSSRISKIKIRNCPRSSCSTRVGLIRLRRTMCEISTYAEIVLAVALASVVIVLIEVEVKWWYETVCGAHARPSLVRPDQDGRCAPWLTHQNSSCSCCSGSSSRRQSCNEDTKLSAELILDLLWSDPTKTDDARHD